MLPKVLLTFVGFLLQCQAYPIHLSFYGSSELGKRDDGQIPEWTAMGDSYASGVGAGPQPADNTNMFHPGTRGHDKIRQVVLKVLNDNGIPKGTALVKPLPPQPLTCHGVGGDTWMLSRDQAVSASEQFCNQDVQDKEYFQGSADSVRLSVRNADESEALSTINDCVGKFKVIIDGCDGNDPINNPHNYKFGGTHTSPDGWEFTVKPTAAKPDEDSCDVSYKVLLDKFEVRGKSFPDATLGAEGGGLKMEIKRCGAPTNWHFKWTPNDVKYQWYAYGTLPFGTKSCMGKAVQSAGGTSAANCHGDG